MMPGIREPTMTFAYHPTLGWTFKVHPKMALPDYRYITEGQLRKALGDLVLANWGATKIRRFLDREQVTMTTDGKLVVPYVQALRQE
jgi:hypothetical protein